ncbi:MAG: radical SAM protein, partial [Geobacter sp.]
MNILLTDKCSNDCPYCFAKEKLEADSRLNQMPLENYVKVLEFLKRSKSRYVKLLGGEPMLHSEIEKIIHMAVSDDWFDAVTVFTGGIFDH